MAQSLKPQNCFKTLSCFVRNYCEKSIYQKHEEGPKPRTVYGVPYPDWRKPWIERQGEWRSKLSVFVEKNPSADILYAMSKLPELDWSTVKHWWAEMKLRQEIENQRYMDKRVTALGSNLAAIHFFTYRRAAVKLRNSDKWISGDVTSLNLPDRYTEGYMVEAVDCTNFHHNGIRFEGIENLKNLNYLKWLSLKNCKYIDVWCLDRIAGQNGQTLEYLDISGCNLCIGCVYALARMPALKFLVLTDPGDNVDMQAALSLLEQEKPNLLIRAIDNDNVISTSETQK